MRVIGNLTLCAPNTLLLISAGLFPALAKGACGGSKMNDTPAYLTRRYHVRHIGQPGRQQACVDVRAGDQQYALLG